MRGSGRTARASPRPGRRCVTPTRSTTRSLTACTRARSSTPSPFPLPRLRGRVVPEDFRPAALRDLDILELARQVDVIVDGNPDPNALVPVTVEINLRDGRSDTKRVNVMYGNPARPMTPVAQLEKFGRNCAAAARPIAPEAAERVIAAVARLESLSDVTALVDDLVPAPTTHPPLA